MKFDVVLVHAPSVYDFRDRDDILFAYLSNSDSVHVSPIFEMPPVGVFALKLLFAALPVAIFLLAPRILGAKSEDGLCCDPDAEDAPVMRVMSATGANLHYAAISGGWLAVLCGVILAHMR